MLYPNRINQLVREHGDAVAALACGVLLLCGWFALHVNFLGIAMLLLPAAYVIGGYESAREGLTTLFQEKELDVDLLMIVAALGAAILGLWRQEYYLIIDGAVLILIFAISGALEDYAMGRTEKSIRSLMSLTPDIARVLHQGKEREISISELKVGDEIIVKPGELIPTDGIILQGFSTLNQAAITGESLPVEKTIGDEVFAGTLNGYGALKLKVHQPPESSLIQRVIRLVEEAQESVPPSQQFIEKFERGYARFIVIAGILLALLPPFIWGWGWDTTIYRALTFLVVASPCALMAAIMPTLLSGIANGAKQGILFKNGTQLEMIGKVRAVAFDKTGTLTTGEVRVYQVIPFSKYSEEEVLQIAASVECNSEHPIGNAIVSAAVNMNFHRAVDVNAIPGKGIVGVVENVQYIVGNDVFIQEYIANLPQSFRDAALSMEESGKTVVWVAKKDNQQLEIVGLISLADTIRPEAAITIARLRQLGVAEIVMLTGDNDITARAVAREVGINTVYSSLLPEDKLHVIRRLQDKYRAVAMVGDGINDAPALAQASVGIAMGKAGSDVALETADVVLMADRLEKIATAIKLGRRAQLVVKQNIAIALASVVLLLIANFLGNINLPIGVVGHEGSTVLVTLSGLRLLRG